MIFEIQKENISCVESLLKIVQLFQLINTFSESDSNELIKISNQIYWNNDKNDASTLPGDIQHNIQAWFDNYDTIFTTNFDCIADDLFMKKEKALHLHGGFYFLDPWTKKPSKLSGNKAFLIWGISGDDKLKMMEGESQSTASSQQQNKTSLFQKYLQKLESIEVNRLDIFGYSGENDQHINNAIINNPYIEEVLCFCDPKSIHGKNVIEKEEFEVKKRFIGQSGKRLIFESWDVVWNSISP